MAIPLSDIRITRGAGIVVVGTNGIALVGLGASQPVAPQVLTSIVTLTDADDPLRAFAACDTGGTSVGLWTLRDGEKMVAVRGALALSGDGRWSDDGPAHRVWRPAAGAFHALGVYDHSKAVPAATGIWAAAGIGVGTTAGTDTGPWWDPTADRDAARPDAGGDASEVLPTVEGVLCPNGHLVNPVARFCHVDGLSLENISRVLVTGPRHPFAGLVVDGHRHVLIRDAVVGRSPEADPRVDDGTAIGITVPDEGGSISRSHLLLEIDGWTVRARDLDSALGTYVLVEGADDWIRIPPGARYEIPTTARFRIGDVEARLARSDIR